MTAWTRKIMVCTVADMEQANALCEQAVPGCGSDTFTAALSADGSAPATHAWCSWQMTSTQAQKIASKLAGVATIYGAATYTPDRVLETEGLQRVEAESP